MGEQETEADTSTAGDFRRATRSSPTQTSLLGGFPEKDTGVEEAGAKAHRLEQTRFPSKPT